MNEKEIKTRNKKDIKCLKEERKREIIFYVEIKKNKKNFKKKKEKRR